MSDPTYFSMPSGWAAHLPKSPPLPHAKSRTRSPEVAVSLLAFNMSWRVASREGHRSSSRRENCQLHDLSEMPSSQRISHKLKLFPIPWQNKLHNAILCAAGTTALMFLKGL